jgi:diguanylate cyclase (GGDEF)-like protein
MHLLIVILLLIALPLPAGAMQELPLGVQPVDMPRQYDDNSVIDTAQDGSGYLWFATTNGLNVYDGNTIRPALEDILGKSSIHDILIDRSDTLWVATTKGILAYSLPKSSARWHQASESSTGLAVNSTKALYEDSKGSIWAGTLKGGLYRYQPVFDVFERIPLLGEGQDSETIVWDICEDAQHDILAATNKGLFRLSGNQPPAARIPLATKEDYYPLKASVDGAGNLWVNTIRNGLWTLPKNSGTQELVPAENFPATTIKDLYTDSEGDLWIATDDGLFRYAFRTDAFYHHQLTLPNPRDKSPSSIRSVVETSPRSFWIGTSKQGAMHFSTNSGTRLIELPGNGAFTRSGTVACTVGPEDSRIYVALKHGGLFRSPPGQSGLVEFLSHLELEPFLERLNIASLAWMDDKRLICGTTNALLLVDPDKNIERVQVSDNPDVVGFSLDVRRIVPMENGRIWFANKHQLFSWQPGDGKPRREAPTSHNPSIDAMTGRGNRLWIGRSSTITEIDTLSDIRKTLVFPGKYSLGRITGLFADNHDNLWIGTLKGIYRFNLQSGTLSPVLTGEQAPVQNAQSFYPDWSGNIWAQTETRIFQISAGSDIASEMAVGAWDQSMRIMPQPAMHDRKNLIYGHSHGLLLVTPQRVLAQPDVRPKISEIRIFDRPVAATPIGRMPESLELEHHQNYLSFSFANPERDALHPSGYYYMLEGLDTTWNDSGDQHSISYAYLKPGRYVLHLKDSLDSPDATSLRITIHPPLWLTPWAKAGYALVLTLTLFAASRIFTRVQTSRIRKEMLENLVMQDPLTGVPNRRKFKEVLVAEKSRCKRSNHQISVIMVDIDYFKGFNDRFGHQAGDKALRKVAQTLSATLKRPEDFVARYGGEEFVVVLPSTNRAGAERVAKKIQDAIAEADIPYPGSPLSDRLTLSLGISTFSPQSDLHIDSGLFSADQALYQAKRNGRNCFFYKDHCLALAPVRQ